MAGISLAATILHSTTPIHLEGAFHEVERAWENKPCAIQCCSLQFKEARAHRPTGSCIWYQDPEYTSIPCKSKSQMFGLKLSGRPRLEHNRHVGRLPSCTKSIQSFGKLRSSSGHVHMWIVLMFRLLLLSREIGILRKAQGMACMPESHSLRKSIQEKPSKLIWCLCPDPLPEGHPVL